MHIYQNYKTIKIGDIVRQFGNNKEKVDINFNLNVTLFGVHDAW